MKFKYCPRCGQQDTVAKQDSTKFQCSNCGWEFWNNPAATASAIFIDGDKALFAKRGREPNKGKYDFPGGFLEYQEDLYVGCAREIKEELGIEVDIEDLELITGYAREYTPGQSVMDLMVIVKKWPKTEMTPQDDVAGVEWKPIEFINDPLFAPEEYTDLVERLKKLK